MKKIAKNKYIWKSIAEKYSHIIEESFSVTKKNKVYPEISKVDKKLLEKYKVSHLQNIRLFNSTNSKI